MTVAQWTERWARVFPRPSKRTQRHNAQMVAPFVRAHGARKLADVSALEAAAWGARNSGHVRYLRLLFSDAVRAGLIESSPFAGVSVKRSSGRANVAPPSQAELDRIVSAAPDALGGYVAGWAPIFARMVTVAAFTGLRASELLDVRMADVLAFNQLYVRRGKSVDGASRPRHVLALGPAVSALSAQVIDRGVIFRLPKDGDLRPLWWKPGRRRGDKGSRVSIDTLQRSWRACCRSAGLAFTWHQLRHFHATWLLDRGASDMDVAVQLGHFDRHGRPNPQLVRELYGHVDHGAALDRLRALA